MIRVFLSIKITKKNDNHEKMSQINLDGELSFTNVSDIQTSINTLILCAIFLLISVVYILE